MSLSASLRWRGVLAIVIGVVSVAWPNITVGAFVVLFAVYAFLAVVTDAMRAFSSDRAGPVVGWLLLAVLSVAGGIIALVWPGITALALAIWVAIWALVTGIVEVALAFRQGKTPGQRAMWILTGLVSVAFGIVLFIRPDIGALSLATVFGLSSIFSGPPALFVSFRARRVRSTASRLVDSVA